MLFPFDTTKIAKIENFEVLKYGVLVKYTCGSVLQ